MVNRKTFQLSPVWYATKLYAGSKARLFSLLFDSLSSSNKWDVSKEPCFASNVKQI